MNDYEERDRLLRQMGFESYSRYLASQLWRRIRERVMRDQDGACALCHAPAANVHHTEYSLATLRGQQTHTLIALCRTCHDIGEFRASGAKVPLQEANRRLRMLDAFRQSATETVETRRRRLLGNDAAERLAHGERMAARAERRAAQAEQRRAEAGRLAEQRKTLPGWCRGCGQHPTRKNREYCKGCLKALRLKDSPTTW